MFGEQAPWAALFPRGRRLGCRLVGPRRPTITVCRVLGYVAAAFGGVVLGWLVRAVLRQPPVGSRAASRLPSAAPARTGGAAPVQHRLSGDQRGRPAAAEPTPEPPSSACCRGGIVDPQVLAAAARAAVSGEPVDVELRPVQRAASLTAPQVGAERGAGGGPGHRRRSHPGGGHRRVRGATGGGGAPRLRRQRLARTEDPGGGDGPARRGHRGLGRRSGLRSAGSPASCSPRRFGWARWSTS